MTTTLGQRLTGEHAQIRSALSEMGVAIELHALREEAVTALLGLLRAHGRREDETLYRWTALAALPVTDPPAARPQP